MAFAIPCFFFSPVDDREGDKLIFCFEKTLNEMEAYPKTIAVEDAGNLTPFFRFLGSI
jgi:hypothetical protein